MAVSSWAAWGGAVGVAAALVRCALVERRKGRVFGLGEDTAVVRTVVVDSVVVGPGEASGGAIPGEAGIFELGECEWLMGASWCLKMPQMCFMAYLGVEVVEAHLRGALRTPAGLVEAVDFALRERAQPWGSLRRMGASAGAPPGISIDGVAWMVPSQPMCACSLVEPEAFAQIGAVLLEAREIRAVHLMRTWVGKGQDGKPTSMVECRVGDALEFERGGGLHVRVQRAAGTWAKRGLLDAG